MYTVMLFGKGFIGVPTVKAIVGSVFQHIKFYSITHIAYVFINGVIECIIRTNIVYGFVCFFMVTNLYPLVGPSTTPAQGAAVLGIGLLVGMVNLLAAIYQGKVCANGIAAIGNGHDVMGKTLILAAFPELYAILTVAATFLIASVATTWGAPEVAEVAAEVVNEVAAM